MTQETKNVLVRRIEDDVLLRISEDLFLKYPNDFKIVEEEKKKTLVTKARKQRTKK